MLIGLLLTLSIIVFLWACFGLLAPGLAGLSSRWQSVLVWAVSVGLFFAGVELAPPATQVSTAEQRDRPRVERPRQQRAEGRVETERQPRERGESMARQQMERIRGGLDDPIGPILAQMPMTAQRRRMGEDRTFTYTFGDGSRLILVARPQGGGRGLALYYVDIED